MTIALGIDTGGTYTDAVLFDQTTDSVLAAAKALTTYYDLSVGIRAAISALFEADGHEIEPADVALVSLSTTLATNAIVEGNASPVALILIGYDETFIDSFGLREELVTKDVLFVRGGHDGFGEEAQPLDEDALRQAILARADSAEAFAISAYFSVRNPAHELRAKALVAELTAHNGHAAPATCGHELTSRLNSVRRATTTALNAGLIPLLADLISTVRRTLTDLGITAPLMVVKGDGSLVRADWAMQRPIETILSGPAASAVGARKLAGQENVWVIDMGGTTTDIAGLQNGRPRLNEQGAQVGRWRTMVEAVDMHTLGLGGDSEIRIHSDLRRRDQVEIGPRRVIPLSLLSTQYSEINRELRHQLSEPKHYRAPARFVLAQREIRRRLSESDHQLIESVMHRPQSIDALMNAHGLNFFTRLQLDRLTAQQRLMQSTFTPTDALHVLGLVAEWDAEAARLGAALLAAPLGLEPEAFCRTVIERVSRQVAGALLDKVLADEGVTGNWRHEPAAKALVERAFRRGQSDLTVKLSLNRDIVGIGAPVRAYLPGAADLLNTALTIPAHAEVANAVGAVAGSVVQHRRIEINQVEGLRALFRAHLPGGVHDFPDLEAAVAHTETIMWAQMQEIAGQAGATQAEITMTRIDHTAPVADSWGDEIYLGTELIFTAAGRPGIV